MILGLEREQVHWTEEETNFLKASYGQIKYREIAEKLGRTWGAVTAKAERLGLTQGSQWSQDEIQTLKELYPKRLWYVGLPKDSADPATLYEEKLPWWH